MTPEQIDQITAHYAFTPADKSALASLMAEAYLHAKQSAYERASIAARPHISFAVWNPGPPEIAKAREWAAPRVDSIAETYEGLLRSQLEQMEESGPREGLGDIWQGIKDVAGKIADWFSDFLGWKTDQIADDTWNEGDNDGTEQFIDDVIGSGTDYSMMRVMVVPAESSSDYCKEYAGNSYSFDDVGATVPEFPTHSNCIHYLEIYIDDSERDR